MIRLFVAFDLDKNVKEDLHKFAKELNIGQARLIQAQNMHITVKFLGYVENNLLDNIDSIIGKVAEKHGAFNIVLDRLGAFPSKKRGRIFWIGSGVNNEARNLAKHLDLNFKEIGFEPEKRPLKIHLTLTRLKKPEDLSKFTEQIIEPVRQNISHITLYESKLSPKGAQYRVIKKYILKKA